MTSGVAEDSAHYMEKVSNFLETLAQPLQLLDRYQKTSHGNLRLQSWRSVTLMIMALRTLGADGSDHGDVSARVVDCDT